MAMVAALVCGCGLKTPEPPAIEPHQPRTADDAVRIAGAGAGTPVMRHLARRFEAEQQGQPVSVESPLGSAGALQAVLTGALDAAVVVRPGEAPRPAGGVLVGISPVVVAAGHGVSVRRLSIESLAATLRDEAGPWPDGGRRVVLMRPEGDPAMAALAALDPRLSTAIQEARQRRIWRTYHDDADLLDALRRTPGAITVSEEGSLRLLAVPAWIIKPEEAEASRWGELAVWLVPRPKAPARLYALLDFIDRGEGRLLLKDLGYERR